MNNIISIVGGFEFTVLQRNLKEWHERQRRMFRNAKGKQQKKIRQLLCQQQRIDHIQYYISGKSRAHFFPTTLLEIAVFINDSILMSHILRKLPNVLYHRLPVFLRMTLHGAFFLFHINASTKLIIIQFQKYLSIYSFSNIESTRRKVVLRWLGMRSKLISCRHLQYYLQLS